MRQQMGDGPQALVLYFNLPLTEQPPLYRLGRYTVSHLSTCNRCCLNTEDLLGMLAHGFQRVFVELSPDIRVIHHQIRLVEEVAACPGLNGSVVLFHSDSALRALLEEGDARPSELGGGALLQLGQASRRNRGAAQGCVTISGGCTLCGQCAWACPTGAIHLGSDGASLEIRDSQCSGCGLCASACPEQVLAIQPLAPVRRRA
ncbi:4Fe-4S binding protein [Epibacterium sp. MM17-32]|nr:4Fe-4S binding protein [Epibacterium sp. MM17-32]